MGTQMQHARFAEQRDTHKTMSEWAMGLNGGR